MVMKMGIGVDIERIDRFERLVRTKKKNFLKKIFTLSELRYSFTRAHSAAHLAARFAAKEAFIKAGGKIGRAVPSRRQIEVVNRQNGRPFINRPRIANGEVQVSLAHERDYAVAMVIIHKYD